jgi:hypothetical protein
MSGIATAIIGSAAVGYAASNRASQRAEDAANNATAAAAQSASDQLTLGREQLEFQKDYYNNTLKPMQERDLKLREDLQAELLPSMRQQREFAQEQNDYYKTTFKPIEEQMAKDATGYDSQENIERRSGIAAANVNQAYSNASGQSARALSRMGINPNSGAFARENAKLYNNEALASAGAQTGAAFDTMDKAIALRAGAANFGRNMPNTAANYYGLGNQTAGASSGVSSAGVNNAVSAMSPTLSAGQIAAGAFRGAGYVMNDAFANNMRMYGIQQQGTSGLFNGLGMFAATKMGQDAFGKLGNNISSWWNGTSGVQGLGTVNPTSGEFMGSLEFADGGHIDSKRMGLAYANGGKVHGPGGPVDDKVPAMLSDGEYVIPADVVKAKGVEFFDKLKDKYHTPAVLQRRGIGRT